MIDAIAGIYAPLLGLLGRLLIWPIAVLALLFRWLSQSLYWLYTRLDDCFCNWMSQ